MRSQLERLDTDTPFGLLQMDETALEELNATVRGFKIPVRWAAPVGCAGSTRF